MMIIENDVNVWEEIETNYYSSGVTENEKSRKKCISVPLIYARDNNHIKIKRRILDTWRNREMEGGVRLSRSNHPASSVTRHDSGTRIVHHPKIIIQREESLLF